MAVLSRIVTLIIAAVAGAVFGVVGTVAQGSTPGGFPVGLLLGVLGAGALVLAVRLLADRWAAVATAVGMTLAVVVFSGRGPGGSVIVPADSPFALIWSFAVPLLAVLIIAWPRLPETTAASANE